MVFPLGSCSGQNQIHQFSRKNKNSTDVSRSGYLSRGCNGVLKLQARGRGASRIALNQNAAEDDADLQKELLIDELKIFRNTGDINEQHLVVNFFALSDLVDSLAASLFAYRSGEKVEGS